MTIVDNFKKIPFATLAHGDVFRAMDRHDSVQLFMKINQICGCNAVSVLNGDLYHFSADDTVSPVNCELVIK